jgi:hypothetical protein
LSIHADAFWVFVLIPTIASKRHRELIAGNGRRCEEDTVTQNMIRVGGTGGQTTPTSNGRRIARGILIAAGVLAALFGAYIVLIAAIFSMTPD